MDKIINVFSVRKFDPYSVDCRVCHCKHDCKSTDAQICLIQDHTPKVDLRALNVQGFKWVIMYRDHYRGNGKGEYFAAADYDRIKRTQPYWFTNTDRPVHTVILTNNDVPSIIQTRYKLIEKINRLDVEINRLNRPQKGFDGRKTRRSAPELYADYDKRIATYNKQVSALIDQKTDIQAELQKIENYSTTLMRIK